MRTSYISKNADKIEAQKRQEAEKKQSEIKIKNQITDTYVDLKGKSEDLKSSESAKPKKKKKNPVVIVVVVLIVCVMLVFGIYATISGDKKVAENKSEIIEDLGSDDELPEFDGINDSLE